MTIFSHLTIAQILAASLTLAASQRIVVVTSARGEGRSRNLDTPMMSSSPFTTGAMHYDSGSSITGYNTEPPCRSRRLELFRQHVREECRLDAATHCPTAAVTKSATTMRSMLTPTYTEDVWLNSLMESVLEPPSSPSTFEDSFENIMNSMLNEFFGHMIDLETIMDGTEGHVLNSPPQLKPLAEQSDIAEAPLSSTHPSVDTSASSSSSSDDIAATPLDEVADNSLDVLVATLAQRFIHSEEEDKSSTADTNLPSSTSSSQRMNDLSQRLSQLGNDLLSETRMARRRRLQESSSEEDVVAFDRQLRVKERVARRLTEYRTDLVYHPGGTVSVYTSSFQPHSSSSSFFVNNAIRALPPHSIVSPVGMGSTHVDECIKSRYENGELSGSCFSAVDRFFAAVKDRNLSPPSHSSSQGTGDDGEPWYYGFLKYSCFWLIFGFLMVCIRPCFFVENDHDDNDVGGDSFDYEMLPEERTNSTDHECRAHQVEKREKVPRVYLGVPVQVV